MYYIEMTSDRCDDVFIVGKAEDEATASQMARDEWDALCEEDKKHNDIEVRNYLYDIEDEDCTCFDNDLVYDWFVWNAVVSDEDDEDYGNGSFIWNEAYEMLRSVAATNPSAELVYVDYRSGKPMWSESLDEIVIF